MKRQGRQASSFCTAPDPQCFAALVFGKPGAPIDEHASLLTRHWLKSASDPLDIKRTSPEDARSDPAAVIDELYSASLFGGASLIQVNIARESEAAPFLNALSAIEERDDPPSGRLLVIAGDLGPRSKLRKAFEAAKSGYALQFYERSSQEFQDWARQRLRKDGVNLTSDAEDLLLRTLLEDQTLAGTELDKLALYAIDRDTPLTAEEVSALVSLEDQSPHFQLIDFALDGNRKAVTSLLPQIAMETAAIPLLIGLVNQLKRLGQAHEISASGVNGPRIGEKLSPRIFDRQWPAFEKRMRVWSPPRILALLNRVAETDRACRRASSPQEALVGQLLLDIVRAADSRTG